jgi:hypothetical protein
MVGTLSQSFACVASEPNGIEHHGFMKLSSGDQQLGLALSLQRATSQSGRTNHPSENERAGCKSPRPHLSEGRGEVFFLDILFHRMSVIGMFQQLCAITLISGYPAHYWVLVLNSEAAGAASHGVSLKHRTPSADEITESRTTDEV